MYDSPFEYCAVCKQYVALDQSVAECTRAHGCDVQRCPLAGLFPPPGAARPAEPAPEAKSVNAAQRGVPASA